jgi:hypothetical protein
MCKCIVCDLSRGGISEIIGGLIFLCVYFDIGLSCSLSSVFVACLDLDRGGLHQIRASLIRGLCSGFWIVVLCDWCLFWFLALYCFDSVLLSIDYKTISLFCTLNFWTWSVSLILSYGCNKSQKPFFTLSKFQRLTI